MGAVVEQAVYFIIDHLLVCFIFVPISIIFLGYVLYIAISVFQELRKNKKG